MVAVSGPRMAAEVPQDALDVQGSERVERLRPQLAPDCDPVPECRVQLALREKLRDNSLVMITAPQIVCWESSEHMGMVVLSGISIVVYICGIPLFMSTVLVYADKYHKLKDPLWLKLFGTFYVSYEPAYYLWELILLFRRFAFCLCMVVFRTNPFAQAGIAVFTIVVCTLFQYVPSRRIRPPASTYLTS